MVSPTADAGMPEVGARDKKKKSKGKKKSGWRTPTFGKTKKSPAHSTLTPPVDVAADDDGRNPQEGSGGRKEGGLSLDAGPSDSNYYIDLESSQHDADAHAQRGSPGVPAEPHGRTHANRASDEGVASPVMPRKQGGPEKFSTVDDINANSRQWRTGATEILSREEMAELSRQRREGKNGGKQPQTPPRGRADTSDATTGKRNDISLDAPDTPPSKPGPGLISPSSTDHSTCSRDSPSTGEDFVIDFAGEIVKEKEGESRRPSSSGGVDTVPAAKATAPAKNTKSPKIGKKGVSDFKAPSKKKGKAVANDVSLDGPSVSLDDDSAAVIRALGDGETKKSGKTKKKPPKKPLVKKKVVPPTSAHNHATQEEASTPSTAPPRMQQGELSSLEQAVGRHQTADDLNKFLAQEEEEYRRAKLASMSTNDVTTETDGKFGTSKASRSKGTKLAKKSSGSRGMPKVALSIASTCFSNEDREMSRLRKGGPVLVPQAGGGEGPQVSRMPNPADMESMIKYNGWTFMRRPDLKLTDLIEVKGLGQGTYGHVTMVKKGNTAYALKIMDRKKFANDLDVKYVYAEKEVMVALDHPFHVKLLNCYKSPNRLYMLIDYAPGGCLKDKIIENYEARENREPPETVDLTYEAVRFYASNIVLGLKHMHEREVIHRDIKPDNLLINAKGYVQICDYGFSRRLNFGQRTASIAGTLEYHAPEQCLNVDYEHSIDLWSLGVSLFELYYGYTPFNDPSVMDLEHKTAEEYESALMQCICTTSKITYPQAKGGRVPFDKAGQYFINSLCRRKVSNRMGLKVQIMKPEGAPPETDNNRYERRITGVQYDDILSHPWWEMDVTGWAKVEAQEAQPPWVPQDKPDPRLRYRMRGV